jgi:hypothetical protein
MAVTLAIGGGLALAIVGLWHALAAEVGARTRLHTLALQQQARGHAPLGEVRDCFTLLDQAAEILREHPAVSDQDAPVCLHHYDLRGRSRSAQLPTSHAARCPLNGHAVRASGALSE